MSDSSQLVPLDEIMARPLGLVAERNFDLYEKDKAGSIRKL